LDGTTSTWSSAGERVPNLGGPRVPARSPGYERLGSGLEGMGTRQNVDRFAAATPEAIN